MALRTALDQNPVLVAGFVLFGAWIALTTVNVAGSIDSITGTDWIGPTGASGLVGLAVMLVLGIGIVYLYVALSEPDPAPESFPPERR